MTDQGEPPLPPPAAPPTEKTVSKKRTISQKAALKKRLDASRGKTRINIGSAFQRWRRLMQLHPKLKRDEMVADFLLDRYFNTSVPAAEDQHLTGGTEGTTQTKQAVSADDSHIIEAPEIVFTIDEESDPVDETDESDESSDQDVKEVKDSDDDWIPVRGVSLNKKPDDEDLPLAPQNDHLCTDCGMFFNKQKPHTCEHKIKPYSCIICGNRFISEITLNSHSRIHDENYEHKCKYCHLTFKTKVYKVTHEQIHQTQEKPYKCPDCSETFATYKERLIHLEDHRQLKCHVCGIEFAQANCLRRHLAVHTGVKPFKCSVCQRGFNQPSHLKSHMRLHTGERPFKCQHCDKCFNHNVSLKSHVERYHSSSSGHERKKDKKNERASDTEAQVNGSEIVAHSRLDDVEEEQDKEEEVQKDRTYRPRSTGRPIGRPKSYGSGNLVEGLYSNTKTGNLQECSDEESESEPSEEKKEKSSEKAIKNTGRSRGRHKTSDSDSDFDPEERKKKRSSSQSSGKRRGGPTKKSYKKRLKMNGAKEFT